MKDPVWSTFYGAWGALALAASVGCSGEGAIDSVEQELASGDGFAERGSADDASDQRLASERGVGLVGFDAEVAREHGFEVVTLPDGSLASVPAERAEEARDGTYVPIEGVIPPEAMDGGLMNKGYSEVPGECGTSYVALWGQSAGVASLHTGFYLLPAAGNPWQVFWNVHIHDNAGDSTQGYGEDDGEIIGASWIGETRMLHLARGWADATVTIGSFAITTRGWICYSYGPSASTEIW